MSTNPDQQQPEIEFEAVQAALTALVQTMDEAEAAAVAVSVDNGAEYFARVREYLRQQPLELRDAMLHQAMGDLQTIMVVVANLYSTDDIDACDCTAEVLEAARLFARSIELQFELQTERAKPVEVLSYRGGLRPT